MLDDEIQDYYIFKRITIVFRFKNSNFIKKVQLDLNKKANKAIYD